MAAWTRGLALLGGLAAVFLVAIATAEAASPWPPTARDARKMIEADKVMFADFMERIRREVAATGDEDEDPILEVIAGYDEQIAQEPSAIAPLIERGKLLLDRGAYDQAIASFDAALRIQSANAEARLYRGRAYERQGKLDQAAVDYRRAMDLDPKGAIGIAATWDGEVLSLAPRDDRKDMIDNLGAPDSFTIIMIAVDQRTKKLVRQETWYYYEAAKVVEFIDGHLVDMEDLTGLETNGFDIVIPPYRPYQFYPGIDFVDMTDIIGGEVFAVMELGPNPLIDGELVFAPQLAMGFKNGGLFYVRSIPFFLGN